MKYVRLFEDWRVESFVKENIARFLHEGVTMIPIESLNESSKYPELKRLLDNANKEGKKLLIAEFVPEIEALVDKFGNSGQSGASAPFTAGAIVDTIKKMLAHEPLGEGIMCTDDEWNDISDIEGVKEGTGTYQNNRLSSVFKSGKEGRPYYLDSIVWRSIGKDYTFTGSVSVSEGSKEKIGSMHYIKNLPFQPKTFVIDVYEKEYRKLKDGSLVEEEGGGWWENWIADPGQLDEVWKYYEKRDIQKK
jgi:hypothetical protein